MSQGLSPASVQNQKGLAAVVNLQEGGESSEAKNKPSRFGLEKVPNASMI